jgi:glycerophosphoryl diester phosphodiesterase
MGILNPVERGILVHGHRGARGMLPENTLPAFEYAISVGVDGIELDVAVSRDDVVVVRHDPKLKLRAIRDLTLAEIQSYDLGDAAHVPTLDQVLALAHRGQFLFNIEIKSYPDRPDLSPPPDHFAGLVFQAIRRQRLERRVIIQSFDFRMLRAMRELAPEIRLGALYMGRPKSFAAIAHQAGTAIVAPHHALVTARKVRAAHAAGLEVVTWTANSRPEWKRLIAAQVDAIITDRPGALVAYLRDRGLRQ